MASIWCFFFTMNMYAEESDQSKDEGRYAELCRYYVAYFEYETAILKLRNWFKRDESVNAKEKHNNNIQEDRPGSINEALTKLESLSFPTLDRIKDYRCELQQRKFIGIDVYMAYPPDSPESYPYKLGIIARDYGPAFEELDLGKHFAFLKLNGFEERIHSPDDTTAYVSYNDQLQYPKLEHVPKQSRESVDEFVADWIQLTQYKGHPRDFRLLSNEYELTDDTLVGRCETEELDMGTGHDTMYLHKEWTYEIGNRDSPKLRTVSVRSTDIRLDDIDP